MSEKEKLDVLEELFNRFPDFAYQMEFHREQAADERSVESLLQRVRHLVELDDRMPQREHQEEAYTKQLLAGGGNSNDQQQASLKGNVSQEKTPPPSDKQKQLMSQKD